MLGGGSSLSGINSGDEMTMGDLQEQIRRKALLKQQQLRAELEGGDRSKNASATSGVAKDGDKSSGLKQIGVVRKKNDKSKVDDSEDEAMRKLKAGSALSGMSKA